MSTMRDLYKITVVGAINKMIENRYDPTSAIASKVTPKYEIKNAMKQRTNVAELERSVDLE